jgi:hypothetical protein
MYNYQFSNPRKGETLVTPLHQGTNMRRGLGTGYKIGLPWTNIIIIIIIKHADAGTNDCTKLLGFGGSLGISGDFSGFQRISMDSY